jgi:uncharacterized protein YpbB
MSLPHFSTLYYEIGGCKLIFNQILLHILSILKNERTVSSAYHLLRGKRSGQTIQDVGIYKLHTYFGLLPKLKRETFDHAIKLLENEQFITVDETGFYTLKDEVVPNDVPYFNGWRYRGNEHRFFSRVTLLIETISYIKNEIVFFAPTEKNVETQKFIRGFLRTQPFRSESFRMQLFQELHEVISRANMQEQQRELLVGRFTGNRIAGYTWQQLASKYALSELDIQLLFVSALHALLVVVEEQEVPILKQLAKDVIVETPLTESTNETAKLLNEGKSLDQIAQIRRLKQSTIEDHIVEIVMNIPSFNVAAFLTAEQVQEILDASEAYATKKLRVLKEVMPHYSYFQLRVALAKGG